MNPVFNSKNLSGFIFFLYIVFFISLAFAFRFFSNVSIGLILIAGIIKNKTDGKPFFHSGIKNLFFLACILFYVLQVVSLFYTQNQEETWIHLRIKSALVVVPLAIGCCDFVNETNRKKIFEVFCITLTAASMYCVVMAFFRYSHLHDTSVFFFHELLYPLSAHAVYFSIYVFIALLYLIENIQTREFIFYKKFHYILIIYFSILLFLLSSKLVISFYLFYLFYYAIIHFIERKKNRFTSIAVLLVCLFTATALITTRNPISNRFTEILHTDFDLVKQNSFNPGVYFNDVQFRILEWKFVTEILDENRSWLTGVSPGDAQNFLNKKYIEKNMYIGEPSRHDRGLLGYNTHSQLAESLLQTGIIGAFSFLLIIFSLVRMALQKRDRLLSFTVILLLAFSLTESVFEGQYSILLFTFFPLFISLTVKKEKE